MRGDPLNLIRIIPAEGSGLVSNERYLYQESPWPPARRFFVFQLVAGGWWLVAGGWWLVKIVTSD